MAVPARDPRRFIYVAIDTIVTIGYLVLLRDTLHNRHGWARVILYLLPVATAVMAIGTGIGRRRGWWLTVGAGVALLLWTVGFVAMLLTTAAYLSGVYGAFGKAAASGAVLAVAFVIEFVALLPALQVKWALTRAGRRAFGLAVGAQTVAGHTVVASTKVGA
jgi:hypothetical protein